MFETVSFSSRVKQSFILVPSFGGEKKKKQVNESKKKDEISLFQTSFNSKPSTTRRAAQNRYIATKDDRQANDAV